MSGTTENHEMPVQTERSGWDPYALPAGTSREQVIAGLRLLATLLEDRPELPTPTSVSAQCSAWSGTRSEHMALLETAAEQTGCDIEYHRDRENASVTYQLPTPSGSGLPRVQYVVCASLPPATTAEVVSAALEA